MTPQFERSTPIRVRPKNQITIPEAIAARMEVGPGDRLLARIDDAGQLVLRKVPKSYAGALAGVWGTYEEAMAELRASRDEWDERERRQVGDWDGKVREDR